MHRLTDDEITMVHAIFSFIDDGRGSTETIESLVDKLKQVVGKRYFQDKI